MKKLILVLVFILIPSASAICCQNIGSKDGGCYPDRNICCEESNKIVGYIGCKASLESDEFVYYCPGEFLGPCLQCSSNCKPDGTGCNWVEVDKCSGLSCVIEYLPDQETPSEISECSDKCMEGEIFDIVNNKCVEAELPTDATCTDDMCASNKKCCGSDGKFKTGTGSVCSGDNDNDNICNYYDNCPEIFNTNQTDLDNDKIGDACDIEERCESAYSDRQCCDLLGAQPAKDAIFYGYKEDCPQELGGVGCWSQCAVTDEQGNEITFEVGPCIDGKRTVSKLQDGKVIQATAEPCSGIPLIPFFTSFNLIFTLLILTLFYYFREK